MNTATLERRPSSQKTSSYLKWFREIGINDVSIVGGKTASLGEMFRELIPKGIKVPDGFAITVAGYWHFLRETKLDRFIEGHLFDLDASDVKQLQRRGAAVRDAILATNYAGIATSLFLLPFEAVRRRKICPRPALPAPRKLF